MAERQIVLSGGQVAVVDEEDYGRLSQYRYRIVRGGYAMRSTYQGGKETAWMMHRDVINPPPGMEVDHKDGNPLNNTKANLRVCTRSQNHANRKKPARRGPMTSAYRGVFFNRHGRPKKPWWAMICKDRKQRYIGAFATEEEAAKAYDREAVLAFGEFAMPNFPLVETY